MRLLPPFSVASLAATWDRLRSSFWVVPALMTAAAIALSLGMTRLDAVIDFSLSWSSAFGPEGARSILSAIASSMITVAGLTFSITMLTLQLATSQFGPRLMRNFMRDRGNQVVLGIFIATFVYCLMVLRTVRGVEGASFVPHLAVATGVLLAIASLAVLIYFIHHTAHSIRIETLLGSLADEVAETIDRLCPRDLPAAAEGPLPDFADGRALRSPANGYVQALDEEALLALATRHDLTARVVAPPGTFVTSNDPLLIVLPRSLAEEVTSPLIDAFVIGKERTPLQDIRFSIRRIVEIAQRSLSPSINDPTTALYCIDRLREALVRLARRPFPPDRMADETGRLRLATPRPRFDDLARQSFAAIAHYAGSDADVLEALTTALDRVVEAAGDAPIGETAALRLALRRQEP